MMERTEEYQARVDAYNSAIDEVLKVIGKRINAATFSQQSHKIYGMKQLRDEIVEMRK